MSKQHKTKPATELLTDKETASLIGMSDRTVHTYSQLGIMPPGRKIGQARRWIKSEVMRWIADGCKPWRNAGDSPRA